MMRPAELGARLRHVLNYDAGARISDAGFASPLQRKLDAIRYRNWLVQFVPYVEAMCLLASRHEHEFEELALSAGAQPYQLRPEER